MVEILVIILQENFLQLFLNQSMDELTQNCLLREIDGELHADPGDINFKVPLRSNLVGTLKVADEYLKKYQKHVERCSLNFIFHKQTISHGNNLYIVKEGRITKN